MYGLTAAAFFLGICIGGLAVYRYERSMRMKEMREIIRLTEDLMNGRRIPQIHAGEETMPARIGHQLARVQEILEGRQEDAEKSRDQIQKLISEIAHQMRTPLTNVETYTGIIRTELESRTETQTEETGLGREGAVLRCLSALEESERKLDFLVESFVKMSRLEQHVISLREEKGDLVKTVRDALGQVQGRAEKKRISFAVRFPERMDCIHDHNWLGEAVFNILDNGVKYSDPGGKIEVSVSGNEMFCKICVRDHGIGVDRGEESRIFQRFYRGKRVTVQEGFGIGLYLAREIVNLHGGFVLAKRMEPGLMIEINLPKKSRDC